MEEIDKTKFDSPFRDFILLDDNDEEPEEGSENVA